MALLRRCLAEIRRREADWTAADEVLLALPAPAAQDAIRWSQNTRNAAAQRVTARQRPPTSRGGLMAG